MSKLRDVPPQGAPLLLWKYLAMPHLRASSAAAGLAALFLTSAPFCVPTLAASQPALKQVASFQHQATGIAVTSDGRTFLSFPR